jgi:hypothetical protein
LAHNWAIGDLTSFGFELLCGAGECVDVDTVVEVADVNGPAGDRCRGDDGGAGEEVGQFLFGGGGKCVEVAVFVAGVGDAVRRDWRGFLCWIGGEPPVLGGGRGRGCYVELLAQLR